MKKCFITLILIFCPILVKAEIIENFSSDIVINSDGSADVTETITYNFEGESRRGIIRSIPQVSTTGEGAELYTPITFVGAYRNDVSEPQLPTYTREVATLRLGDENIFYDDVQTYTIHYRVEGVIQRFSDTDEFYWDITGDQWSVPIVSADTQVVFPIIPLQVTCYQGESGADTQCSSEIKATKVLATTEDIYPGEGMTLAVEVPYDSLPTNALVAPATFGQKVAAQFMWIILIFLGVAGIGTYYYVRVWNRVGRDNKDDRSIVAEYDPPLGLRAYQAGTLFDHRFDTRDLAAVLLDLARREIIKISQKKSFFNSQLEFSVAKRSLNAELSSVEKEVVEALRDTHPLEKLSWLVGGNESRLKLTQKRTEVTTKAKQEISQYYETSHQVRNHYWWLPASAVALGFISILVTVITQQPIFLGVVAAGLYLVIISSIIFTLLLKRNHQGNEAIYHLKGYKLFLEKVETYRQEFLAREGKFAEMLPYAVAFGIEKTFTKQTEKIFKETDTVMPALTWLPLGATNNISEIVSQMQKITSQVQQTASAASGGGSSGGGFSGGGAGGGGGSSW